MRINIVTYIKWTLFIELIQLTKKTSKNWRLKQRRNTIRNGKVNESLA